MSKSFSTCWRSCGDRGLQYDAAMTLPTTACSELSKPVLKQPWTESMNHELAGSDWCEAFADLRSPTASRNVVFRPIKKEPVGDARLATPACCKFSCGGLRCDQQLK